MKMGCTPVPCVAESSGQDITKTTSYAQHGAETDMRDYVEQIFTLIHQRKGVVSVHEIQLAIQFRMTKKQIRDLINTMIQLGES